MSPRDNDSVIRPEPNQLSMTKPDYTVLANRDLRIEEEEKHGGSFCRINDSREDEVQPNADNLARESKITVNQDGDLSPSKS